MADPTLASSVATLYDNSTHGEDTYLIKDLGGGHFLDAVMDGVTGHGGEEASRSVATALDAATIAGPGDVVAALEEQNADFFQVGGGRFLLTTVSVALFLGGPPLYHQRRRQPGLSAPRRRPSAAFRADRRHPADGDG